MVLEPVVVASESRRQDSLPQIERMAFMSRQVTSSPRPHSSAGRYRQRAGVGEAYGTLEDEGGAALAALHDEAE